MSYINIDKFHDKKGIILDFLTQTEDELSKFLHDAEDNQSIPDDTYLDIENRVTRLFELLTTIRDEIIFS